MRTDESVETRIAARPQDQRARLGSHLPVTEKTRSAAAVVTSTLEGGGGPPMVLLHGAGEFAYVWMRVIPDLAETHRLIVPDLPGHGESDPGDDPLTPARVIDWLEELIVQTCDMPPIIVGHLLGGAIALRLAIERPHRAGRLVLVDTFGLGWLKPAPRFALAMASFMVRPNQRTQERLFRGCFVDLDSMRDDMGGQMQVLEAYALEKAQAPRLQRALRSMMPSFGVPPIPPAELARVRMPISLIWGREDLQVRLRTAERASVRFGWPLRVIDGAADDPAIEQPAAFLEALYASIEAAPG